MGKPFDYFTIEFLEHMFAHQDEVEKFAVMINEYIEHEILKNLCRSSLQSLIVINEMEVAGYPNYRIVEDLKRLFMQSSQLCEEGKVELEQFLILEPLKILIEKELNQETKKPDSKESGLNYNNEIL